MDTPPIDVSLLYDTGRVRVTGDGGREMVLHPHWLRERSREAADFDPVTRQRLFEPSLLPPDLRVVGMERASEDELTLTFSDGALCGFSLTAILREAGWLDDPETPPAPQPWEADLDEWPGADWAALEAPEVLRGMLAGFARSGFCILRNTPTQPGTLESIAKFFGHLRDTNFGPIFDVITKPQPIDLAYTGLPLSAHADNPYRQPIPGIQMLHCLENGVEGGLSTLVDGFALAQALMAEAPELARVLERTTVRFRYESDDSILENRGPMIERDGDGRLVRVRFSSRVDFVPPLDPETLDMFYRGRSRMFELAADPRFEIRFRLDPSMLVMMDNHRLLHGRTGFDHGAGRRHLQGCYIDHDGPDAMYRVLSRRWQDGEGGGREAA
jgi:gamma-butyrobetaine dioxygenase